MLHGGGLDLRGFPRTLRAVHVILIQVTFLGRTTSLDKSRTFGEKRDWKNGWEESLKHSVRSENVEGRDSGCWC